MNHLLTALMLIALAAPAFADDDVRWHFQEGMRLLAAGDFDGACAEFEKSEAKGPAVGSSYQLGRCNEGRGKFGLAYESYKRAAELADKAGDGERADIARQRAGDVEPKAPRIQILVAPERQVAGLSVRVDGKQTDQWNSPTPIGEGEHHVEIAAPGRKTTTITISVAQREVERVAVPELEANAPVAVPVTPDEDEPEARRRNPALFWTGMGLVIAGGAAIIVGGALVGEAEASGADTSYEGVALLVGSAAFLGVGIPFMVIFGRKEPADSAVIIEPRIGLTSASLRISF